jgi:transcriptional regulator with XRE-family HTH domain
MTFGEFLKKWRKAKGMTQPELAKAAGINISYVSNLERNFSANKKGVPQPSRDLCKRFAKVLEVPEADVLLAANYAPDNGSDAVPKPILEALAREGKLNPDDAERIADFILRLKQTQ